MSATTRAPAAVLTLIAVALLAAPGASAATRTIDFDDLYGGGVIGTPITNQYAAQGVRFNVPVGEFPGTLPPQVCNRGFYAQANTSTWTPPNFGRVYKCGNEFGYTGVLIKVDRSRSVSARVGGGNVRLEAYNAAGGLVAVQDATGTTTVTSPLQVDREAGDIAWAAFFKPTITDSSLGIDNFSFDAVEATEPPPPPPTPDFQVSTDARESNLALAPGTSRSTVVTIRRLAGSNGPIRFSAENVPPGVSVSFAPNPAGGGDGERVRATFTAAADAPAVTNAGVTIRATPRVAAAGRDSHLTSARLSVPGRVDLRLRGIDVIQAVQPSGTLLPGPISGGGEYRGTRLAAGQKTIARVFADATGAAPPGVRAGVQLRGYDGAGRERSGGPIFPEWAPDGVSQAATPGVFAERVDPKAAYTFVLPPAWTHGELHLRAEISPFEARFADELPTVECARPDCQANNVFDLTGIPFERMHSYWIRPVGVVRDGGRALSPPARVFDATRAVTPGPLAIPNTYVATLNNTSIDCATLGPNPNKACASVTPNSDPKDDGKELADWKNTATRDLVYQWSTNYRGPGDFNVGVNIGTARGLAGEIYAITNFDEGPGSNGGDQRPLTSVAHEFFHLLGRPHASPGCGGKDGGDVEPWPPDERGRLNSLGLDRREGSGGPTDYSGSADAPPPFRIFQDLGKTEMYDLMSYCAAAGGGDSNSWVSLHNWEETFQFLSVKPYEASAARARLALDDSSPGRARLAAAAPRTLEVNAFVGVAGAQITSVRPPGPQSAPTTRGSAYSLVARNAAGAVVASAPMESTRGSDGGLLLLRGRVPSKGAARVEVVAGGSVRAVRARSANAPRVRVVSPRRAARVGGARRVRVRWRARDRDGDRLQASVDYSANDGRTWRTVFIGPDKGGARVPSRLLYASRRARLRVRVSDGFNESRALSGRFQARGARPSVRIASPTRRLRTLNDAAIFLSGEAFDDSLRRLRGRRLGWYLGRRRIARGENASVSGLPAGRRRIRLVARDRLGRSASASVVVRLVQARPAFLRLKAPRRISRRARSVRLRVTSSVPARLRVGRRSFRVARKSRLLRVPVRRGRRTLTLRLVLRAGRLQAVRSVRVRR